MQPILELFNDKVYGEHYANWLKQKLIWPLFKNIPIIVSYGIGVDSTALLVLLFKLGLRPTAILFAHVGNEWPETYAYRPIIDAWLAKVGFPPIQEVRYKPKRFKWGRYSTLFGNLIRNSTLPGLAFGRKTCSIKWKGVPLDKWVKKIFKDIMKMGIKPIRLIGYDASPKDLKRCGGVSEKEDNEFQWHYPLISLGWDRDRCKQEILSVGLPIPHKSSCFFCPAMQKAEVIELKNNHPFLLKLALWAEDKALPNLTVIKGLWGRGIEGKRDPSKRKPGSWREFIENN